MLIRMSVLCLFVASAMTVGCAGGNGNTKPAPIPTAGSESTANLEPKERELPRMPPGAGEIDADAPKTLTPTESGLYYRILRKSDEQRPTAANTVTVNYHGWLDDRTVFDSSYQRGEAISFGLNQVIKGWTEGMQLVGKGGMIELEIPSNLGYGAAGSPPKIGPGATLHFIVELLDVK